MSTIAIVPFNISEFASRDESRPMLCKPWKCGDFVFATDGRVMIRVPATLFPEVEPEPNAPQKQSDEFFTTTPPDEFWQQPPPGVLDVKPTTCDECDDGIDTCPHCDRSGPCENCDGTGVYIPQASVPIGPALLNQIYLAKLGKLSGVMLNLPPTLLKTEPVRFRFNHGIGVLMQMRKS